MKKSNGNGSAEAPPGVPRFEDRELAAMKACVEALCGLPTRSIERTIRYLDARFRPEPAQANVTGVSWSMIARELLQGSPQPK
jgi:hypothetical protein